MAEIIRILVPVSYSMTPVLPFIAQLGLFTGNQLVQDRDAIPHILIRPSHTACDQQRHNLTWRIDEGSEVVEQITVGQEGTERDGCGR